MARKAKGKGIWLRLALFILVAGFAVASFTHGVMSLGHRENGWYEIGPDVATAAVTYDSGVHLLYYAEGSSSEIRQETAAVQKAYSALLLRWRKLLDAQRTYDDTVNLASIIAAGGAPVEIDGELRAVLADALERTEKNAGYSLFAGALWREWETLLYLDEPQPFDPANSPEEAARLAAMAAMVNDGGQFALTLGETTAAFSTAQTYRDFEEAQEIDAPALDLNALREAYLVEQVARGMTGLGLTRGYLYTDGGLTVLLDAGARYDFDLWAPGESARLGSMAVTGPAAFCQRTAFAPREEKYGWYALETEDGVLLRHSGFDARTGGFHDVLEGVALASQTRNAVDLAFNAIALYGLDSREEIEAYLAALEDDTTAAYLLADERDSVLHARGSAAEALRLYDEAGYRLEAR